MPKSVPSKFEFDLVSFVSEHDGISVRDIYDGFGKPQGFVRGTIVKTMDRLLKKGLVERELVEGTFVYRSKQGREELDRILVQSFVEERLGGSISPLALFLSKAEGLDPNELRRLREILDKLEP